MGGRAAVAGLLCQPLPPPGTWGGGWGRHSPAWGPSSCSPGPCLAQVLKGHDDHVITCLQFCGNRIVSGSDDNTLKVWSAVTGEVSLGRPRAQRLPLPQLPADA